MDQRLPLHSARNDEAVIEEDDRQPAPPRTSIGSSCHIQLPSGATHGTDTALELALVEEFHARTAWAKKFQDKEGHLDLRDRVDPNHPTVFIFDLHTCVENLNFIVNQPLARLSGVSVAEAVAEMHASILLAGDLCHDEADPLGMKSSLRLLGRVMHDMLLYGRIHLVQSNHDRIGGDRHCGCQDPFNPKSSVDQTVLLSKALRSLGNDEDEGSKILHLYTESIFNLPRSIRVSDEVILTHAGPPNGTDLELYGRPRHNNDRSKIEDCDYYEKDVTAYLEKKGAKILVTGHTKDPSGSPFYRPFGNKLLAGQSCGGNFGYAVLLGKTLTLYSCNRRGSTVTVDSSDLNFLIA